MSFVAFQITPTRLFVQQPALANDTENTKGREDWPFVRVIHRWPMDSTHEGPVMRKACQRHDVIMDVISVLILVLRPANERRRHNVTPSLIGANLESALAMISHPNWTFQLQS